MSGYDVRGFWNTASAWIENVFELIVDNILYLSTEQLSSAPSSNTKYLSSSASRVKLP